jgi:curli biogenesis system outer membrane secretion channel CsgG
MLKKFAVIAMILMASLSLASLSLVAQTKTSVAVDAFDYSTVMTSIQAVFGTQVNIGAGIRAMMVKRITDQGKLTVVERAKVDNLLKEQDFGASGRVKQGTQAKIGNIRGAQLAVMGDIVVFGRDDRKVGGNAGGFGGGILGRVGAARKTDKAVVVLNYRLVNIETSEVITAGEARGESKRTSTSIGGFMGGWNGGGGGNIDMSSSNFAETIIGEATMAAVDQLATDLGSKQALISSSMPVVTIEARVAVANGNSLTISVGSTGGVKEGDKLQVLRVGNEIKDPVSGEVLDVETTPLGELVITTVRDRVATGTYTGSQAAKVGDMVRSK